MVTSFRHVCSLCFSSFYSALRSNQAATKQASQASATQNVPNTRHEDPKMFPRARLPIFIFYGPRQHRQPMPGRCQFVANLVGNFSQGRPWNFSSPLEASKSAFGELLARKSRAGGGQGAPGGLRGRFLEPFWLPKRWFWGLFFEFPWHGVFRLHLDSFLFDFLSVRRMFALRAQTKHTQILS